MSIAPLLTVSGGVQGLPYAVTGTGDLLAVFRCVSCRYNFSTDPVLQPKLLGAVGRVYATLEVREADEATWNLESLTVASLHC